MNVLLASVGRCSYLVRYFQFALQGRGKVVATNSIMDAPAMLSADRAYVVPTAADDTFLARMLEICEREEIGLLCSLHDWEVPFLAAHLEVFERIGVRMAVSRPEVIQTCLNKEHTARFCTEHGVRFPRTYASVSDALAAVDQGLIRFPLMVKPGCGQGSIELYRVQDAHELEIFHAHATKRIKAYAANGLLDAESGGVLIQEMIHGTEFGLDVVHDLQGRFAACFVKRKIGMRAGETDVAETVDNPDIESFGRRIGQALGHVGMLDVDVMVDEQGPCLLELNPRFGGHYPFSHEAGANIPAALIAWAEGREPDASWLRVTPGIRCGKDIAMVRLGS
jgi:carbamoyl-phosphate synthase large subunit